MEQVIDFDEWLANYKPLEVEYLAEFNSSTGEVLAIGPSHAFSDTLYTVNIDRETAELIIEGKIKISDCIVDLKSQTLEMLEIKNVFKIDDVLHRVVGLTWTETEKPDIFITYDSKSNSLKFELTEEYSGTKVLPEKFQPVTPRKIVWSGETVLNFLITDYNDPNVLYNMVSFKIADLIGNSYTIESIDAPERFSVYTRRIFKNYVIEYK